MQSVPVKGHVLASKDAEVGGVTSSSPAKKPKPSSKNEATKETPKFEEVMESQEKKPEITEEADSKDKDKDTTAEDVTNGQTLNLDVVLTQIASMAAVVQPDAILEGEIPQQPAVVGNPIEAVPLTADDKALDIVLAQQLVVSQEEAASNVETPLTTNSAVGQEGNPLPIGTKAENGGKPTGETTNSTSGTQSGQLNFVDKLKQTVMSMSSDSSASFESSLMKENQDVVVKNAESDNESPQLSNLAFAQAAANASDISDTSTKATAVEKLFNRIVDDFNNIQAGSSEIRIQLEPYELGAVTITVLRTASGITAKIKSEDREICSLISDQIQKLVHNMQDKGIEIKDVDVVYGKLDQNMNFAQDSSKQSSQQDSRNFKLSTGDKKQEMSEISELRDILQGDPSLDADTNRRIEYRV